VSEGDVAAARLVSLCEDCGKSWGEADIPDYDFSRETCPGCGSAHVHAVMAGMERRAKIINCRYSGDGDRDPKSGRDGSEADGKAGEHFPLTASKREG